MPILKNGQRPVDIIKTNKFIWKAYISEETVWSPTEVFLLKGTKTSNTLLKLRVGFTPYRQCEIVLKDATTNTVVSTTTGAYDFEIDLSSITEYEIYLRCHTGARKMVTTLGLHDTYVDYGIEEINLTPFPNLVYLQFPEQDIDTIDLSTLTKLMYVNLKGNNLTALSITNNIQLESLEIDRNDIGGTFNITTAPNLKVFSALRNPFTQITYNPTTILEKILLSNNTVPQATLQGLINSTSFLVALELQQIDTLTSVNVNNKPIVFFWVAGNPNLTSISWTGANDMEQINISANIGITSCDLTGKNKIDTEFWVTGTSISPATLDACLNHISSLNLPPNTINSPYGRIIYGDFETVTGEIEPTSASLTAYDDLVFRGYDVIGPIPS